MGQLPSRKRDSDLGVQTDWCRCGLASRIRLQTFDGHGFLCSPARVVRVLPATPPRVLLVHDTVTYRRLAKTQVGKAGPDHVACAGARNCRVKNASMHVGKARMKIVMLGLFENHPEFALALSQSNNFGDPGGGVKTLGCLFWASSGFFQATLWPLLVEGGRRHLVGGRR